MPAPSLTGLVKEMIVRDLNLATDPESIDEKERLLGGRFDLDSVDIITLVTALENSFHIWIPDEDIEKLNSVQEIVSFIKQRNQEGKQYEP